MTVSVPDKRGSFCPSDPVEQVRHGCALGALASVIAIEGAIPITHCGPGCAQKQFHALSGINGYQGGEFHVPSTNVGNREVVFGGAERLDELIGATLGVMKADLYVVQSGCVPGLIGDDVESVVESYRRQGVPIVHAETAGYDGTNFTGHDRVAEAILEHYAGAYRGESEPGLVNVWATVPFQNPFWRGDLEEIHRLLEGIGLTVNILFGHGASGVGDWRRAPNAAFNLVLSPWVGLGPARLLERRHGQPVLHIPAVPIGAKACAAFLRRVASFAGLDLIRTERFIAAEERRYYLYLRDFAAFYANCTSQYRLPSAAVTIGDSATVLAVSKFLSDQLGVAAAARIVTENPPEHHRLAIAAAFAAEEGAPVVFAEDGHRIREAARAADLAGHLPIVLGTTWDGELAGELGAPLVEIGYPATDEVVLSRSYVGYRGALQLLERIYTTVVRAETQG